MFKLTLIFSYFYIYTNKINKHIILIFNMVFFNNYSHPLLYEFWVTATLWFKSNHIYYDYLHFTIY